MRIQLPNNPPTLKEWYQQVIDACDFDDSVKAFALWRLWDAMIVQLPATQKNEIMKFQEKLLFTAFPELPLDQAVHVIEKRLLHFLGSEVNIDTILKRRFLYAGYTAVNEERTVLREAALHNEQMLGGKKVFEWLKAFDQAFPPEGLEVATAGKFFTQYSPITSLNKTEQAYLRRLLQVYDEWLRAPLTTVFDAAEIYKKLVELEKVGVKEVNMNTFTDQYFPSSGGRSQTGRRGAPAGPRAAGTSVQQTIPLALLPALSKYPQLSQMPLTGAKIRLRTQVEPVRPTLMNWLKYYRSELGIGYHSGVQRGDFLYRSENGRKLSEEERERLNLILKSVEEEYPLNIDPGRQEIIFP